MIDDTSVEVIGFSDAPVSDVVIPSVIPGPGNGYAVTQVAADAFRDSGIVSLVIGDNITTIGAFAFAFDLFTSVTIPASVQEIGESAFESAPAIQVIMQGDAPEIPWPLGPFSANAYIRYPLGAADTPTRGGSSTPHSRM